MRHRLRRRYGRSHGKRSPYGTWSKPHHGVSHLLDVDSHKGQVTIEEHGGGHVVAYVLRRGSFTPIAEETFTTLTAAKSWGARRAWDLDMLKGSR